MDLKNSKILTFVDLFSGCGGFSLGIEQASMNCSAGIDNNEHTIGN